jgi:putative phosphoesterase
LASIVILSDTHTERDVITDIKAHYPKSPIFHCGDSELPSDDPIWSGITVVAGNCDYDPGYETEKVTTLEGKKILLTHGHLQAINIYGLTDLANRAEVLNANIVFFGHIHRPVAELIDNRLFLNPGSASQPRGEIQIKMYATLDILPGANHTIYRISYKDLTHQPIPQLQYTLEAAL